MHALLIHQAFVSPEEAGGTRHYEFASHLVEKGHQCTIVASNISYLSGNKIIARNKLVTQQSLNGITVLRAYTFPTLHRSFFWRVMSFLCFMFTSFLAVFHSKPVDIIIGTTPPLFQAISAWFTAKIRRRPFLLEVRDLWPEFAIDMGVLKNRLLITLAHTLETFLYNQATHIVVNSPAYRDYLVGKSIPEKKISLIANGVNPEMFTPSAKGQRIRQEFALHNKFVVTYAGALGLANDIDTIVRAAKRFRDLPQIHFFFVGDGKERSALQAYVKELELPNITFTGALPKTTIPEVLAASDVCVATLQDIPMFRTTYPNKVFDYMAAGRPTILAIDGVIRHVIDDAQGGIFVPPGNDAAMADAIQYLYTHQEQSRVMGAAARAYVVENFDRHRQAEQFLDLLLTLAEKNAG